MRDSPSQKYLHIAMLQAFRASCLAAQAALAAQDDSDMAGSSHHSPHHSRTDAGPFHQPRDANGAAPAGDAGAADAAQTSRRSLMACIPETELPTTEQLDAEEVGGRGQKAYKRFVEATGGGMGSHQVPPVTPRTCTAWCLSVFLSS